MQAGYIRWYICKYYFEKPIQNFSAEIEGCCSVAEWANGRWLASDGLIVTIRTSGGRASTEDNTCLYEPWRRRGHAGRVANAAWNCDSAAEVVLSTMVGCGANIAAATSATGAAGTWQRRQLRSIATVSVENMLRRHVRGITR